MRRLLIAVKSWALVDALTREVSSQFKIHSCSTGTDVSYLIEDLQPDALVIDLRLPRHAGFAVLESCTYRPPIMIALSEFIDNDVIRQAKSAGIAVLIRIPCTARCVAGHLQRLTAKTPTPEL